MTTMKETPLSVRNNQLIFPISSLSTFSGISYGASIHPTSICITLLHTTSMLSSRVNHNDPYHGVEILVRRHWGVFALHMALALVLLNLAYMGVCRRSLASDNGLFILLYPVALFAFCFFIFWTGQWWILLDGWMIAWHWRKKFYNL